MHDDNNETNSDTKKLRGVVGSHGVEASNRHSIKDREIDDISWKLMYLGSWNLAVWVMVVFAPENASKTCCSRERLLHGAKKSLQICG
jgi:hypothetical protein